MIQQRKRFQIRGIPKDRQNPNLLFAEQIQRRYAWKAGWQEFPPVSMRHRKQETAKSMTVSLNQKLIEQVVKKYMPGIMERPAPMIQRQERSRLLSVVEEISHQDGERKLLEQLIFRRKEAEWKRVTQVQEEWVRSLQEEVRKQRNVIETVVKRMEEPVFDKNQLFAEFRRRLEQQLWLERLRAGL